MQMEIIYAARAFILQLIGGILLPDVNQNKFSIMYLPLLEDLELAERFSSGSAVLACLYHELCRATKPSTKRIGGCYLLLQSWALYRMPFLTSWHDGGRVLRQFGCAQPNPNPLVDIKEVHGIDKKGSGRDALNWAQKHEPYIFLWNQRHSRCPPLYVLEGGFSPTPEYAAWYMAYEKPFIFQGQYMLIQRDAQPESSRWQPRNAQPRGNRVPPFGNIESDTTSNLDLEAQYEASCMIPDPLHEIPPLFEYIFGGDLEPQHSTRSRSSLYQPEFHPEAHTPTTEDIFPLAPPVTQYQITSDYSVYDYSTFLSTPDAEPSNYQTP
ncbi:hypothetical protein Gotur_028573 [Gossypium turneri]